VKYAVAAFPVALLNASRPIFFKIVSLISSSVHPLFAICLLILAVILKELEKALAVLAVVTEAPIAIPMAYPAAAPIAAPAMAPTKTYSHLTS
jgi:hypothetical protein